MNRPRSGTLPDRVEPSMGNESAWQRMRAPQARSSSRVAQSQEELYTLLIGQANQAHYLRKFAQFDRDGKASVGWHWPAFFVTFYWLLYRKSWLNAVLYAIVPAVALAVAGAVASPFGQTAVAVVSVAVGLLVLLLPPLYADAAYYRLCKKRIATTLALPGKDPDTLRALLIRQGGTSRVVLWLILLLVVPCIIGIVAAVALPAYQDYAARAHASRGAPTEDALK